MTVKELMEKQHRLMAAINPAYINLYQPIKYTEVAPLAAKALTKAKTDETVMLTTALTSELHEVLRELPWKPWKRNNPPIDREKLQEEIADCWHFLLELTMLWNMEDEIEETLNKTFLKNHTRAVNGY